MKEDISPFKYDSLILGSPTLGDGELPGIPAGGETEIWAEFLPQLKGVDLTGKTVALFFGLGGQEGYPDNFVDALGIIYKRIKNCGAAIVGEWPADGYDYNASGARGCGSKSRALPVRR